MFDTVTLSFAIFGFTIFLVAVDCYVAFLLGKSKTKKEVAKANIQAVKSAKQTGEEIEKLSDADLRNAANRWVRPEADR